MRQQALKMGYFYWLRVKNLNRLHTELSLGLRWPTGTKHFPESKTLPRMPKHFLECQNTSQNPKTLPRIRNTSQNPKHFPESKTHPRIQTSSQNPKHFPHYKTTTRRIGEAWLPDKLSTMLVEQQYTRKREYHYEVPCCDIITASDYSS